MRRCVPNFVRRLAASPTPTTFSFMRLACLRHQHWSTSEGKSPYDVLGVSPTATQDDIKHAYKKLALQFHPDRNHDPGAEDQFKRISEAYNMVGTPQKRQEYDSAQRYASAHGYGGSSDSSAGSYSSSSPSDSSAGSYSSSSPPYGSPRATYNSGGGGSGGPRVVHMSKDDADRLFREMFGSSNIDQIFRDFQAAQNPFGYKPQGMRDQYMRGNDGTTYRVTTWSTGQGNIGESPEPGSMFGRFPGRQQRPSLFRFMQENARAGRGGGPVGGNPFGGFGGNPFGGLGGNPFANPLGQYQQAAGGTGAEGGNSEQGGQNVQGGPGGPGYNGNGYPFGQFGQPPRLFFSPLRLAFTVACVIVTVYALLSFLAVHPGLLLALLLLYLLRRRPF